MNNYILQLKESNKNRNKMIELTSNGYVHLKEKHIKAIMLKNKFCSISEYERLLEQKNEGVTHG